MGFYSLSSLGQEAGGCLQTLARANEEFNAGRFFGIPSLLKRCIDNGFTNEQRIQAYHLLSQAYLILGDPIAAEDSYLKLLRVDPEYIATPEKDPIDLVYLSKKFTATPVFTPHFRLGGNVGAVRTIHAISTEGYPVPRSNNLKLGYHLGFGVDWNINDHLSVASEIQYAFKSFKVTKTNISVDDRQEVTERQYWFDIPLYLKYRDNLGKVRPFGYAGLSLNLLVGANVQLQTENVSPNLTDNSSRVPTEGPNVNIGYKRNFLNRSIVVGGGAYYKIGKDFIFADLRYIVGLTNLTKESKNYYNEDGSLLSTAGRYRWIGDYYRLDNLSISIGYVKPIYNPRRIKRANTKKVLKSISKESK